MARYCLRHRRDTKLAALFLECGSNSFHILRLVSQRAYFELGEKKQRCIHQIVI